MKYIVSFKGGEVRTMELASKKDAYFYKRSNRKVAFVAQDRSLPAPRYNGPTFGIEGDPEVWVRAAHTLARMKGWE